jgi:putative ABC transport system permease protein
MKLNDKISISLNDLKKRKLRTFITALSIAIGTMLVIDMFGIGDGMQKLVMNQITSHASLKDVKVYSGDKEKINKSAAGSFLKLNKVAGVEAELDTEATEININNKNIDNKSVAGIDTDYDVILKSEMDAQKVKPAIYGRTLKKHELNAAVVGKEYLDDAGIKNYKSVVGKYITLSVKLPKAAGVANKKDLLLKVKIVGVINQKFQIGAKLVTTADVTAKMQEYYADKQNYIQNEGYSSIFVEGKDFQDVTKLTKEIQAKGYKIQAYAQQAAQIQSLMKVFKIILLIAGIIVLGVACLGVINTMTMSVQEKTKWIGIMKALGASKKDIKGIFLVQSGVVGFLGGILGSLLSVITSQLVNAYVVSTLKSIRLVMDGLNKILIINIQTVAVATVLAILMSMVSGFRPSAKAAKLDPVETLSYE